MVIKVTEQMEYNGILCVDKPAGFTSFDVIAKLRGILNFRKIGHGGTLDPMATGVLPLFLGKATRAVDLVQCHDKAYYAQIKFGLETDTLDVTGRVLKTAPCRFSEIQLKQALASFQGRISQLPPMYSAVQVGGRRLYDIARAGGSVERTPRMATVYEIRLVEYLPQQNIAEIFVSCAKGTYIRTIADDLGHLLGCGAILTKLERSEAMGFTLADCYTLQQIESFCKAGAVSGKLLPVDKVFGHLPKLTLCEKQTVMFQNGVRLDIARIAGDKANGPVAVYGLDSVTKQSVFLGIAQISLDTGELVLKKSFFPVRKGGK